MVPSASYCIVILGIKRFNCRVHTGNKLISKDTVDYSTSYLEAKKHGNFKK